MIRLLSGALMTTCLPKKARERKALGGEQEVLVMA